MTEFFVVVMLLPGKLDASLQKVPAYKDACAIVESVKKSGGKARAYELEVFESIFEPTLTKTEITCIPAPAPAPCLGGKP